MMKNLNLPFRVFLIVKWRKDLSVFCFLIMRTSIKWNLPLKFRNLFVRYVLVITNLFSAVCKVSFRIFLMNLARELELHYQNVLYIVCKLVGFYVKAEYHTSEGRVDMVLQADKFIYIMEFKLNGTAEEALRQIEDKHYARPFATDSRKLFKIGVNFSVETRNIEKWLVEN